MPRSSERDRLTRGQADSAGERRWSQVKVSRTTANKKRRLAAGSPALVALTLIVGGAMLHLAPGWAQAQAAASAPATNPHLLFTPVRPATPADRQRGAQIVTALAAKLKQYPDYKAAQADGYKGYYLNVAMPIYHFASSWRGFKETMRFDPSEPTALLYEKRPAGFKLIGAMYYAPARLGDDQLNARIPLSLVRWHRQINVCLPSSGEEASDDKRFGSAGSIVTEAQCKAAGGSWYPSRHGWMAEVYPFASTPERIWAYRPEAN
jgi:hypothetical protein